MSLVPTPFRLKRWLRATAVATATLALPAIASAAQINLTYQSTLNSGSTVVRTISDSTTGTTSPTLLNVSLFQFSDGTDPLYAYCIEAQQAVGSGLFDIGPLTSAPGNLGGMSSTRAGQLQLLFGQVATPFAPSLASNVQAALQIAIWEIVRENSGTLNVTSGTTSFSSPSDASYLTLAQSYLNNVTSNIGTPLTGLQALTNQSVQDLLVRIPTRTIAEPATLALLAGVLVAARGRRRTAGRVATRGLAS